jgi:NADPH-dependent glutamate synthase beta subunit-like oxidoreductase
VVTSKVTIVDFLSCVYGDTINVHSSALKWLASELQTPALTGRVCDKQVHFVEFQSLNYEMVKLDFMSLNAPSERWGL